MSRPVLSPKACPPRQPAVGLVNRPGSLVEITGLVTPNCRNRPTSGDRFSETPPEVKEFFPLFSESSRRDLLVEDRASCADIAMLPREGRPCDAHSGV